MSLVIKKILYATDLSKNSAFAFQYATDYAEKHGAQIVILHVFEDLRQVDTTFRHYFTGEQLTSITKNMDQTVDKIKSRLSTFCDNVRQDDPACIFRVDQIDVCGGYPANMILDKADEYECDVIFMGTHGKGFVAHAFLGSVAEKVLRRSRKPVFTIPLPEGDTNFSVNGF